MNHFFELGIKMYRRNRKTYNIGRQFYYTSSYMEKIKCLLKLIVLLPFINLLNRKAQEEIILIRNEGNIYKPKGILSNFYLPNLDLSGGEFIQNTIFYNENYFEFDSLQKIKRYINNNDRILDIGANIGNHTLFFLNECQASYVACFEPVKTTFDILKKNIEINGLQSRVALYNMACGEANGKGSVSYRDQRDAGSTKIERNEEGSLQIVSLDTMPELGKLDFVKIDVEGFEYYVLSGMKGLLRENAPILYIEIMSENMDKVDSLLKNLGYFQMEQVSDNDYLFFHI